MTLPDASSVAMRPAVLQDVDALVAIDAACFPTEIAYPREEITSLLRTSTVLTLVAECGSSIVGFATLGLLQHCGHRCGELITIDVLPQFRRKGLGAQMHNELEKWLRAGGGASMDLHVAVTNLAALHFYQGLGYRILARIPHYYPNATDAWRMRKNLA